MQFVQTVPGGFLAWPDRIIWPSIGWQKAGNAWQFLRDRLKGKKGGMSIEMMIVIAIMGVIIMGALGYMTIMMRDTKVNTAISDMTLINTKVNEMYMHESSFDGLTAELFIKSGNAPANMINSTRDGLRSPWGELELDAASSDAGTDDVFTLTFHSVPEEVCLKLGTVVRGSANWQSVEIGSSTYDVVEDQDKNMVEFLSDACQTGTNTMIFTSRRQ